jgi:hypothetical protein
MNNILVIGNGPSTKNLNFHNVKMKTFCVNNCCKIFKKINFYPTYFGSFDKRHCKENKEIYIDMILNSPIEKFFIPKEYISDFPTEILNHPKLVDINVKYVKRAKDLTYPLSFNKYVDGGNSGINAVLCSYILGFKNIYLIGCDASYNFDKKDIPENLSVQEKIKMVDSSYFLDGYYDKESDIQFFPTLRFHRPFWISLFRKKPKDLNIINCSPISKLKNLYPYFELEKIYDLK